MQNSEGLRSLEIRDGEPPRKQIRRKIYLEAPDPPEDLHLSLPLWFDLILSKLYLVELIQMKRTCKSFATYKRLKRLIKEKEWAVFGSYPNCFRNKMYVFDPNEEHTRGIDSQHAQQRFVMFVFQQTRYDGQICKLGVLSSKARLWAQLLKYLNMDGYLLSGKARDMASFRININLGEYIKIKIRGLNDELKGYL